MIDFSKMRFLVVDDFSEFRSSIRGILRLLAVQKIDTAASGDEVLELCRRHRYDVILHDYNLGDGISGQQVLEQLHAEKLLSPHCIFIMVTAENTQAMVLAALECEPDDYLTKPFNKMALQTRLERLVRRKRVLAPVLNAMERNNPEGMLQACQAIEEKDARHAPLCLRYKAGALEQLARWPELEQLLESQARSRPTRWNLQALASLWLRQGRLEQVGNLLVTAVRQFPMIPELRDIQSALAARQNDLTGAQQALQEAVALSPNTISRQIQLAQLAWLNGSADIAVHSLRHCWETGRYSPLFDQEILWQLASIVLENSNPQKKPDDVLHWLKLAEKNCSPALQHAVALLQTELERRKGKQADNLKPLADSLLEHSPHYSAVTLLQLGDWLQLSGEQRASTTLWQHCAARHAGNPGVLPQLVRRLPQLDTAPLLEAIRLGREAAALHVRQQVQEATALFQQALQSGAQQVEVNLAAARLFAEQLHQQPTARQLLNDCLQRIGRLSKLEPETGELARLQATLETTPW